MGLCGEKNWVLTGHRHMNSAINIRNAQPYGTETSWIKTSWEQTNGIGEQWGRTNYWWTYEVVHDRMDNPERDKQR